MDFRLFQIFDWVEKMIKKVEIEVVRPLWLDPHRNSVQNPGLEVSKSFLATQLVTIWGHFGWIEVPGPACTVLGPLGPHGASQSQFGEDVSNGIVGQEFIPGFPGFRLSTRSSGSGSGCAVQDLPFSCRSPKGSDGHNSLRARRSRDRRMPCCSFLIPTEGLFRV